MENKIQNQNEVELAKLFQVEELEERMEFGKWSVSKAGGNGDIGSQINF